MENKDRMLGEGIARQELHLMFIRRRTVSDCEKMR